MENATLWRRWVFATTTALLFAPNMQAQVIVNEDGIYDLRADTAITLDGKTIPREFLDLDARGYRARYIIEGDLQSSLDRGFLKSIDLETRLRGPVTSIDPLAVLEQPVIVTEDTVLVDVPENDIANIQAGDILEISGLAREDGSTEATMLKVRTDNDEDDEWKVEGVATDVTETGLFIGDLEVLVDDNTLFEDCEATLEDGQYVEIESLPIPGHLSGDPIVAEVVECDEDDDLDGPPGDVVPAEIEGIINEIIDPERFTIGNQVIVITAETEFENGSADSLQVGIRAEVEGLFDADTDELIAEEIEFHDDLEIEIEAPVDPEDIVPGSSIRILGLEFSFASDIDDEDGVALSGLSERRQIELEGVLLPDGTLLATDISDEGEPRDFDISLEGLVDNISSPTFEILGITVDATEAEFDLRKSQGSSEDCDDESEGNGNDDCDDDNGDEGCDDESEGNSNDDCDDDNGDEGCDDESEGNSNDDCDDDNGDEGCDDESEGNNDDDCNDETSLEAFFSELTVGSRVSVEGAAYDAATNTLFAGVVELEDGEEDDETKRLRFSEKGVNNSIGVGLGTITGSDRVFSHSFE